MPAADPEICPLCHADNLEPYYQDKRRYFQCQICQLVSVAPEYFLAPEEEKAEYDLHQNDPDDPGYRKFLSRLYEPVHKKLKAGSQGLDFGSGPGPTLSLMFEEAGFAVALYDPFYAPDRSVFKKSYNFIVTSEVVEHLHQPRKELETLWSCLIPGGIMGIMTKRVLDKTAFASWHYKNDRTHVCFFSQESFHWLADHLQADLEFYGDDVVLLIKNEKAHA